MTNISIIINIIKFDLQVPQGEELLQDDHLGATITILTIITTLTITITITTIITIIIVSIDLREVLPEDGDRVAGGSHALHVYTCKT